ncbi:hypothetical protein IFM89_008040 [Coptis chinensis]|uniref:Uncharacterized protein n=1 Tax=Coptis chinensis TaxID=261450 RepID=A0A835HTP7_9MAGN|nr:hypothetical protein IFM89_008040 [Coptis chinensis]
MIDLCSPTFFCAIMDPIWKARNNKQFQGSKSNQQSTLQHAYTILQDWNRAFTNDVEVTDEQLENDNTSTPLESSWINPPPSWVKLNFDASFHQGCYYANIAVIGRDSRGEFLGGKVSRVKATSPGEAEALAAELAINYVVQQHWRVVIVEGDAKSVILACADMISASSWTWNQALYWLTSFRNITSLWSRGTEGYNLRASDRAACVTYNLERNENGSYRVKLSANATKTVSDMRRPLEQTRKGKNINHPNLTPSILQLLFTRDGIALKWTVQRDTGTFKWTGLKEKAPDAELVLSTCRHALLLRGDKELKQKLEEIIHDVARFLGDSGLSEVSEGESSYPICLCEVDDCYQLETCSHCFCRPCLVEQCKSAIKSHEGFPLCCSHEGCGRPILLADLRSLLVAEKLEDLFRASLGAFVISSGGNYRYRMDKNYRVWVLHGENPCTDPVVELVIEEENTEAERLGMGNFVDASYRVHEVVAGDLNEDEENHMGDFEPPPVLEPDLGKRYNEYKNMAEQKLYPSCEAPVTTLSAIVDLHNLKKKYGWSGTSVFALLSLLRIWFP